jgi:hypothetical protein
MPRPFSTEAVIRTGVQMLEDDFSPATVLYYISEFSLPSKVIAHVAGISQHTLHLYSSHDSVDVMRPTEAVDKKLKAICARLKTLEAEGKLVLTGSVKERSEQLTALLTVEDQPQ